MLFVYKKYVERLYEKNIDEYRNAFDRLISTAILKGTLKKCAKQRYRHLCLRLRSSIGRAKFFEHCSRN
jgi:hypothetical protein